MNYNVVYAQMGRGKTERTVAFALAGIAATLSKLSYDACVYNSQNFGFIRLPDEFTTGSSIMPHKKNPDIFELVRSKCNKIQDYPQQITLMINNLPSGYFRDLQLLKEIYLPAFGELNDCIEMIALMMQHIQVNTRIVDDERYRLMFSVEKVNELVLSGVPFRDAYKQIGQAIEQGKFDAGKEVRHTHEGSIGKLCNEEIAAMKKQVLSGFEFEKTEKAIDKLLAMTV